MTAPGVGSDEEASGFIEPIEIQEEMERSFLEYSMSVIVSRALPDVRDGLKPVHRRILYSMYDQRLLPDRPRNKCAKVVGDVMGSYHPHGDSADLRGAGPHGPGLLDAPSADRRARQLRWHRTGRRSGGDALHRVPPGSARPRADAAASTRRRSISSPTTTPPPRSRRSCRPGSRTCWSTGPRASRWAWPPTSRPTTWARSIDATTYLLEHPDATPDDLMAVREGPDFPTGGSHPRSSGNPGRAPHRQGVDQDAGGGGDRRGPGRRNPHRGHRNALSDARSRSCRRRSRIWCGAAISTASPRPRTTPRAGRPGWSSGSSGTPTPTWS